MRNMANCHTFVGGGDCHRTNNEHKIKLKFYFEYGV